MKKVLIMALLLFSLGAKTEELKCSLKGTKIYTVNGVQNSSDDAVKMFAAIDGKIIRAQIDKSPENVEVQKIYNPSHGLTNDMLELIAQDLKARGIVEDPWKYIGFALLGMKFSTPRLDSIRSKINKKTLFDIKEEVNKAMYSPEQLQKADESVVNSLKNAVKNSLDVKKKIIVVAHSQGNSVTNLAMTHLKNDSKFNKDYMPYLGVLHVASPVNWRAIDNSQLIKLSSDLIVWNIFMQPFSESANYQLVGYKDYSPVSNTLLRLLFSNDKDYAHHVRGSYIVQFMQFKSSSLLFRS